jgi:hypothetical protein
MKIKNKHAIKMKNGICDEHEKKTCDENELRNMSWVNIFTQEHAMNLKKKI